MRLLLLLTLLIWASPGLAVIETYEFDSTDLEERYFDLTAELRCPKCQNQNIADSNAPIAADLRKQLHTQLHAGKSDAEIADYMVQRYGEFVLYRPRWSGKTALLWLAPALLLIAALAILVAVLRRSGTSTQQLEQADRAELQDLLNVPRGTGERNSRD